MTDTELRSYLLGQAPPDTAERIEALALDDESTFAALRSLEDDLYDDYVRGALSPGERDQFVARFGHQRDRLAFARALAARAGRTAAAKPARFMRYWMPLAAAASLAIVATGLVWSRSATPVPTSETVTTPAPAPATPVTAVLTLGRSRAAGAPVPIAVPPAAPALELRVRIDPADRFDRYALVLRSMSDTVVWNADDVRATGEDGQLTLGATVPAGGIADGSYELAVTGINTGATPEPLGFISLRIARTP